MQLRWRRAEGERDLSYCELVHLEKLFQKSDLLLLLSVKLSYFHKELIFVNNEEISCIRLYSLPTTFTILQTYFPIFC